MSLKECKECGKQISSKAEACPNCGVKLPKRTGAFTWVMAALFAAVIGNFIFSEQSVRSPVAQSAPISPAVQNSISSTAESLPIAVTPQWSYSSERDEMSGKMRKSATLDSENMLNLKFPYSGKNQPTLTLRTGSHGVDVLLQIDKGQLLCHSYSRCTVTVKFDDRQPVSYSGIGPSDGSSTTVFIKPEQKFIKEMKTAKKTTIQMTVFHEGEQMMRFNTSGLKWN